MVCSDGNRTVTSGLPNTMLKLSCTLKLNLPHWMMHFEVESRRHIRLPPNTIKIIDIEFKAVFGYLTLHIG